jgi:uncharacterized membrane protein
VRRGLVGRNAYLRRAKWNICFVMESIRTALRGLAAVFFVAAGIFHFVKPDFYIKIVPPYFPAPDLLVVLSGMAEIAGGLGLLIPRFRRAAGYGLIALLIAVYPANIYMARHPEIFRFPPWLLCAPSVTGNIHRMGLVRISPKG